MKKKILGILVCMLLLATGLSIMGTVAGDEPCVIGEMKDQYQENFDKIGWLESGVKFWQEFVPTISKHTRAEVYIGCYYGGSPPLKLSIEKPLGSVLTFKELPASTIPLNTEDWVSFDFPDVNLIPGEKHFLVLYYEGAGEYAWGGAHGDPYPQGDSIGGPGWDFCFKTFVEEIELEVEIQSGFGMGVTAVITNAGTTAITEELECTITIDASLMILGEETIKQTPQPIPPGNTVEVNTGFILGFGPAVITAEVSGFENNAPGLVLGPFVYVF